MYAAWTEGTVYPWMTWEEIRDAAASACPIVVPVGSTEQHGRHLPVCTDWVLPTEVARRANEARPVVVGPTVPFGYRSRPGSGGGQHFPGTVSLRATTFMALVEDVLSELVRRGGHEGRGSQRHGPGEVLTAAASRAGAVPEGHGRPDDNGPSFVGPAGDLGGQHPVGANRQMTPVLLSRADRHHYRAGAGRGVADLLPGHPGINGSFGPCRVQRSPLSSRWAT